MLTSRQLRARRALLLYKVNGNSALLVLNGTSLICNNALLALNWRNEYSKEGGGLGFKYHRPPWPPPLFFFYSLASQRGLSCSDFFQGWRRTRSGSNCKHLPWRRKKPCVRHWAYLTVSTRHPVKSTITSLQFLMWGQSMMITKRLQIPANVLQFRCRFGCIKGKLQTIFIIWP